MKSTAIVLALFFSAQAFAAGSLPGQTFCSSDAEKGHVTLQETVSGVEVHLSNAFRNVGNIGSFPIATRNDQTMLIQKATLQQVTGTRVITEALVSLLNSMPDEGDRDMSYAYANDFIQKLQCK